MTARARLTGRSSAPRRWAAPVSMLAAVLFAGCAATVTVTPVLKSGVVAHCQVIGRIAYDGNRDYLPGTLRDTPDAASPLTFRYGHESRYGSAAIPVGVTLLNPLTFVGFPTGSHDVVVTGVLEVLRGATVVRSYGAAAGLKGTGTMFSEGETFTSMRQRGLLLVRDNIAAQLCADHAGLEALRAQAAPASAAADRN